MSTDHTKGSAALANVLFSSVSLPGTPCWSKLVQARGRVVHYLNAGKHHVPARSSSFFPFFLAPLRVSFSHLPLSHFSNWLFPDYLLGGTLTFEG